ncbi:MAG: hypothetical protein ACE5JA_04190 [bacterium]
MRGIVIPLFAGACIATLSSSVVYGYPPAVGIVGPGRSCMTCHTDNGPWKDENMSIIDILDAKTKKSLRANDGSFVVEVPRWQTRKVLTVIGRAKGDTKPSPYRNAWLYVDPTRIKTTALSKFAPGWNVNLPMSCRLVGDKLEGFEGARITAASMTIRPTGAARDADLELQVMLTSGESVKRKPKKGLLSNYFLRTVHLKVVDH